MSAATATGLVFLALTIVETAAAWAAATGRIDYALSRSDAVLSLLSIGLGATASAGLLSRRVWGWWAAIGGAALTLLGSAIGTACDPDLGPASLAALGFVALFEAVLLALLDRPGLRASLEPPPPSAGFFARLPVGACAQAGVWLVGLGLALSGVWGWFLLAVWLVLILVQRRRRLRRAAAA